MDSSDSLLLAAVMPAMHRLHLTAFLQGADRHSENALSSVTCCWT